MTTKEKLKTTYLKLSEHNDIKTITVTRLITTLEINRSTFYYHYETLDALLNDIENDFFSVLFELFHLLAQLLETTPTPKDLEKLTQVLEAHYPLLHLCFIKKPLTFLDSPFFPHYKNELFKHLSINPKNTLLEDYKVKYILNAQLWLWTYWLKNRKLPIETVIELGRGMLLHGLIPTLLSE